MNYVNSKDIVINVPLYGNMHYGSVYLILTGWNEVSLISSSMSNSIISIRKYISLYKKKAHLLLLGTIFLIGLLSLPLAKTFAIILIYFAMVSI